MKDEPIDDSTLPVSGGVPHAGDPVASAGQATVGYCQQCGRPLTAATLQPVGNGVFCPPCATVKRGEAAGWQPVPGASPYPANGGPIGTPASAEPNPVLAGLLGLIPGVGAMYNGQYAKGAIHLIVFVVLVSLADNLSWVLWWLVWGWIFYQAFEAYHTALARRDGNPLPDPFGWNDLGDRLGFGRTTAPATPAAARYAGNPPAGAGSSAPPPPVSEPVKQPFTGGAAPSPYAATTYAASINPYSAPPSTTELPPSPSTAAHPSTHVPFQPTFTGPSALPPDAVLAPSRRFPVGALWLIGLGVLFLLGNILPNWHLDGRWLVPILLAAVALWTGSARYSDWRSARNRLGTDNTTEALSGMLVFPAILLTVAILLALQDASLVRFRHSWPALLIVWGALLLLGRAPAIPTSSAARDTQGNSVVP